MQQSISSYYGPRVDSVEGLFRGWYDVLRTYDGKGIQYDRSGNPVSYDGKTFSWNGKQLIKVTAADGSYTEFSYDANGIRTQKRQYTSGGTLEYDVDYVWQDGLLTHQSMTYYLRITIKNETRVVKIPFSAKFVYDESNTPVGCLVNGEAALAFVRNLQGDIIAVVNQEGTALLEYSYDPWGKVTITQNGENLTEQEAAIIAVLCPFAYRGYNYDYTTGLYYLQSRYYNPEWGRFLNVDDTNILLSTQGENLGANLFAYCGNNPVNMADYDGKKAKKTPGEAEFISILEILTPYAERKYYEINIRANGLICASIDIHKDDFYVAIKKAVEIQEELTYLIIALIVDAYIKKTAEREFLFRIDCIAFEIKAHVDGYVFGKGIIFPNNWLLSGNTSPIGNLVSLGVGRIKSLLDERGRSIDIFEGDVYNHLQAVLFRYSDGIRSCYYHTEADPYMSKFGIRLNYRITGLDDTGWEQALNSWKE